MERGGWQPGWHHGGFPAAGAIRGWSPGSYKQALVKYRPIDIRLNFEEPDQPARAVAAVMRRCGLSKGTFTTPSATIIHTPNRPCGPPVLLIPKATVSTPFVQITLVHAGGFHRRGLCSRRSSAGGTHERWPAPTMPMTMLSGTARPRLSTCLQPGADTPACAPWTPTGQAPNSAILVTHNESISIADYFHPCTRAMRPPTPRPAIMPISPLQRCRWLSPCTRCSANGGKPAIPPAFHILDEHEIRFDGIDELGVLLYGHRQERLLVRFAALHRGNATGSRPTRTPTGLQVTSAVIAPAWVWALENPAGPGIVEADELDYRRLPPRNPAPLSRAGGRHLYGLDTRPPRQPYRALSGGYRSRTTPGSSAIILVR